VAATPPSNYNASSIKVDPDTLWVQGNTTLPAKSLEVAGTLSSISTAWNALKLSWFGGTAEEANQWNTDYLKIIDRMFGPEDANATIVPGEAILPKIGGAAAAAASNFGNAEDAVVKVFQPFIDAKPGPPGSGRDYTGGPITELNKPKTQGN
jgi:hypothetical protein